MQNDKNFKKSILCFDGDDQQDLENPQTICDFFCCFWDNLFRPDTPIEVNLYQHNSLLLKYTCLTFTSQVNSKLIKD